MIGWIDGSAGASGDMLLGALVDSGVPVGVLQDTIDLLDLGISLRAEPVERAGLAATKVHVDAPDTATARRLSDVIELLAVLPDGARTRAESTFRRLAEAEASVHRTTVEEVHFHEVGALDAIADIVGVCAGFAHLDLDELHCSTLSLGSGRSRSAHGPIPVPVPAVLALLDGVAPVVAGPAPFESTTPTGAALLAEWVDAWGPMPALTIDAVGSGAGSNDSDVLVNACRLVTGDARSGLASHDPTIPTGSAVQLEANVDDLDPRVWPSVIAAAMGAGALDAWITPIVMKKGRPAHTLSILCEPARIVEMRRLVFAHTSTIGMREHAVLRHLLDRVEATVDVGGGDRVRVKLASIEGRIVNRSVEWDDVADVAERTGRTTDDVLAEASAAAHEL